MTLHRQIIKAATFLGTGQLAIFACRFVRTLIVARVLTKADYGIASTFALTVAMLETISNLSVDRLLVQSKEGDTEEFQSSAHTVQIVRGLFMMVLLLVLAKPVALLFERPEALAYRLSHLIENPDTLWAFYLLAIIPFIKSFLHFDVFRMEREMHMIPSIVASTLPQVIVTIAAYPVTIWLNDYSALLWLLIAAEGMRVVASHLFAQRPYRVGFNRKHLYAIVVMGWPLLLNGLLLFAIMQGDRYIVGAGFFYGVEGLAVYNIGVMLVMAFYQVIVQVMTTIMLPTLSQMQDDPKELAHRYTICAQSLCIVSALYGTFMIIAAQEMVLIYKHKYAMAAPIVAWYGAAQAVRLIRVAPTLGAMAIGDTKCLMGSNIWRLIGVGIVFNVACAGYDLVWIAIAALVSEVPALVYSVRRFSRKANISPMVSVRCFPLPALAMICSGIVAWRFSTTCNLDIFLDRCLGDHADAIPYFHYVMRILRIGLVAAITSSALLVVAAIPLIASSVLRGHLVEAMREFVHKWKGDNHA